MKIIGSFQIDRPLHTDQNIYLDMFYRYRRIARDEARLNGRIRPIKLARANLPYGLEGEFYISQNSEYALFDARGNLRHPYTHPNSWCPFRFANNRMDMIWSGMSTTSIPEWAEFYVEKFFLPWGYTLNGSVDVIDTRKQIRVTAKANHIIAKDI